MIEAKSLPCDGNRFFKVTTDPTVEPISVADLKTFARIDGSDEDTMLSNFIVSARQAAENYLGIALISQTITLKMDFWPSENISLPRPPLISITAVETLDEDDTASTYSSDNYYIITTGDYGQLVINRNTTWPLNTVRDHGGYQIRYVAGYGTAATDVPRAIRDGLFLWATDIYENRVIRDVPPPEAMSLLQKYRIERID